MNNPNNNNVNNVTSIHPNNSSTNNTNSYHLNSSNSTNPMNPNYLSHSSNTGHPVMNNQSAFHMNNANSNMMSHSSNPSQMVTNGQVEQFPYALTPQQIENLQNLIRQFKALGKRFAESKIPKLIEAQVQSLVPQTSTDSAKSSNAPETSHNPPSVAQMAPQVPPAAHQHSYMSQTGPHSTPLGTQPPVHLSSSLNTHHSIEKPVPQVVSKQIPVPTHAERSSITKDPHHPQTSHHPPGTAPTSAAPTTSQAPLPSSSSSNNLVQSSTTSQVTTNLPSLSLSWQCFHSLLLFGTSKNMGENAISFPPSDVGCFSKGAYLPLVLTIPGITSIREELVKSSLILNSSQKKSDTSGQNRLMTQCFYLQRHVRGNILKTLMEVRSKELAEDPSWQPFKLTAGIALGTANYFADLIPSSSCYRVRKQSKREIKIYEKEDKKKRIEIDEKRKKKISDYHKALMDHRDAFQKFHKNCRNEASRVAKLVKGWVDNQDSKRERDEARSELKRLQALKENDMEAYMALLQDTKNGRLKFLLNETDNYIATINRMIQEQRSPDEKEEGSENQQKASLADLVSTKSTETAKNYYSSTHRKIEIVQQPRMLKGGDLKEYQLSGLQWLVSLYNNNLNGILADEMGLGKTIQTIALLSYLMEFKHNNGPFLIVVPLSTLSNWVNEFNKWAPDIIKVVYKGTPDDRKRIFKEEIESHLLNVLITTYEYIMKDKASLRKLTWQYIIVDEGHRMKNAQSKFAQTLGNVYQSKHRILLTGTPLQNSLPELWALLNFLLPTIFSSVDTFDQWFNKPFAQFRNQAAANAATGAEESGGEANTLTQEERMLIVHRLHEVLRPFVLRRVKDQVLDQLPEKVEKILRCSLSGWQRKMYHSITVRTLANKAKESIGGGLNNTIMQLRKVCNHPYLFIRDYIIDEDMIRISGKFELLDRMLPKLKAAGHRILIFSQMVEVMNFLEQFFNYRGFYFLRLDGNTTADEREKRMYMFNDPNSPYFIFLLSTKAGGLGLNLATADTVIIFDSDWNPMVDAQAQDRAHRIGQKNEVRVFRLLTNSAIEEKILARATDKLNLTGLVVEAGKFNSNKTTEEGEMDNKEMMESLLREWSSGGAEMSGYGNAEQYENTDFDDRVDDDIPDEDQINEMMAAYDGEYELYQKMDQELAEREGLNRPPRLMKATERPPWLTAECWPTKYSVLMTDMMTTQPLRTLSSTGGQTGPKKKGRKRKNADESLLVVQQLVDDGDGRDSPSVADWNDTSQFLDDSYSDANIVAGKVMRKRKEVKYDDGMTEFQFKKFLERQAVAEESQQHEQKGKRGKRGTAHLNSLLQGIMKIIQEIQKIKKTDGTVLAELFLEKPSKVYYPDYYQIIESPISLKEILSKLRNEEYRHFEEIENDFALMSHNARLYNGDLSPVFQTSESIRREFYLRTIDIRQQFNISSLSDPITRFGNGASSANGKNSSQQEIPPLPLATYQIFPKGKSYVGELIMQETKPRKKAKLSGSASKDTLNLSFNGGGDGEGDDNYGNDDYGEDYDNQSQSNSVGGGLVLNFGGIKPKSKR